MIKKLWLRRLLAFPAVFLLVFTIAVFHYVHKFFKDVNLEQILFFINTPTKGVDGRLLRLFIEHCILTPSLYALLICYLPEIRFLRFKSSLCKISYIAFISLLSLLLTVSYIFYKTDYSTLHRFFSTERTDFYENHYADPKLADIQILHKKNLIVLHIESLEKTFENKSFFGKNLLADLHDFETDNTQFSNFQNGYATDFTQGSVIALFTGMPLKYHYLVNKFGRNLHFFYGYYSLSKILKDNGYALAAVQGTDRDFGGMGKFLSDNDLTDLTDLQVIKQKYPQYKQNGSWGYTDDYVFAIAKDKVIQLSQNQPYFLYVQTIDSHVGYKPEVPQLAEYDNQYYNIIHYTQKHLANFLRWMRQRSDYNDTVIVIVGDHLRMGDDFPMPTERSIYNLFINVDKPQNTNRTFTQVDLFPTIIEAMGGIIKNHRLGIGTSVFSAEKTFSEIYSEEFLHKTLAKRNKLYEKMFMQ